MTCDADLGPNDFGDDLGTLRVIDWLARVMGASTSLREMIRHDIGVHGSSPAQEFIRRWWAAPTLGPNGTSRFCSVNGGKQLVDR